MNRRCHHERFEPLSCQQPGPVEFVKAERGAPIYSSKPSTTVMSNSNEDTLSLFPLGFIIPLIFVLDHLPVDPAISPITDTGHQLATQCRSFCAE